jgi:hypothetical protein
VVTDLLTQALDQPSTTELSSRSTRRSVDEASALLREVRRYHQHSQHAQLWCLYHSFLDKQRLPFSPTSSPLNILGSGEFIALTPDSPSSSASPAASADNTPRPMKVCRCDGVVGGGLVCFLPPPIVLPAVFFFVHLSLSLSLYHLTHLNLHSLTHPLRLSRSASSF